MEKGYKLCPYCGEEIKEIAKKCRYCHEFLDEDIKSTKEEKKYKCNGCGEIVEMGDKKCHGCGANLSRGNIYIKSKKYKCNGCGTIVKFGDIRCPGCGANLRWGNIEKKDGIKMKKTENGIIYRSPLDTSYIKCLECGYEGLGGKKEVKRFSDYIPHKGLLAVMASEMDRKDMVVCPMCDSSNVIETKYEKATGKDKLIAYGIPLVVIIGIILLLLFLS